MEVLSTHARAFSRAVGVSSPQSKVVSSLLNFVPSMQCRSSEGFAFGHQSRRISGHGCSRLAVGEHCSRKNSTFVVHAGGVAAANSAPASTSFEELKRKGDSYFLTDSRPVILFDGVCNMCNGGVNLVLDNDAEGKLRFAALQSEAGRALLIKSGRTPDDITSVVLVDKDRAYIKSEAVLRTAQYLGFPFPPAAFLAFAVPLFLRDILYDIVADNRYSVFGQTNVCRMSDLRFGERFIG